MIQVAIEAIAYEMAPHLVHSTDIETRLAPIMDRLQIERGLLERMTGIESRRFFDPGVLPSQAATLAARKVLEKANIGPDKIGCLINTSVCRDYLEPSVACFIHNNLELPASCINFDIANACVGFLNGLSAMKLMIESGQIDYGIVVNAESTRDVVDRTIQKLQTEPLTADQFMLHLPTLTIGSGAVAFLLCRRDLATSSHVINGAINLAATQHSHLCLGNWDQMVTKGAEMVPAAVALIRQTWKVAAERLKNWRDELIDHYVPHQVGLRQVSIFNRALGISESKVHHIIKDYGNMGPATMPFTLALTEERGQLKSDEHIVFLGVGSGLNCVMMSLSW